MAPSRRRFPMSASIRSRASVPGQPPTATTSRGLAASEASVQSSSDEHLHEDHVADSQRNHQQVVPTSTVGDSLLVQQVEEPADASERDDSCREGPSLEAQGTNDRCDAADDCDDSHQPEARLQRHTIHKRFKTREHILSPVVQKLYAFAPILSTCRCSFFLL